MGQNKPIAGLILSFKRFYDFLEKDPRMAVIFVLGSLCGIGFLDYTTGEEYSFSVFYLIPVSFAAWRSGRRTGVAVSLVSAAVWIGIDFLIDHQKDGHPQISYWNSLVGCGFFLIVSVLISALNRTFKAERAASELKTRMVSFVSHEINNSLASMNLALTLLQEDNLASSPVERKRMYEVLGRVYSVIRQTSANFLNQARMQEGRFAMDIVMTDPLKIISETVALISPLTTDKALAVNISAPKSPVLVLADPDALLLLMTNLVGNAVKYTPKNGKISIRLIRERGKALFEVEDTGIGMSEDELERINTPYHRTDDGKKHAKGFGIGLNLCRELLQAHGSSLRIESKKGSGTKISFTLPVR
jgi:signal transduction histidine kinase